MRPPARRLAAAALALVALLITSTSGSARGYRQKTIDVAPGVRHIIIKDPRGPFRIHVVSAELDRRSTFDVELSNDRLPGFETTSSMAHRRNALVAINGDYARENGRPVMAFVEDGRLIQSPLVWGRNFAVSRMETTTYIGHPNVKAWAYESDSGAFHEIARVNNGNPYGNQIGAFTYEGGRAERPPAYSCAVRLYPSGFPHSNFEHQGIETEHYVDKTSCQSGRVNPNGGTVLSTPVGGQRTPEMAGMTPGETVTLGYALGWDGVFDSLGGNPTLVEGGRISVQQENGAFFKRHPRTGVGSTPDGRVLMVTVDGRRPGYSVGMTPRQFASLFIQLGADYALNLDGGGSTTMAIRGRIVNRPSDGYQRPVSSALLLLPRGDSEEQASPSTQPVPAPTPSASPLSPRKVWSDIVEDPASTGGLAAALKSEKVHLPRFLKRAAERFDRR